MEVGGGTVYGNRITIDIDSINYNELMQEIISEAVESNLKIEINYTYPTWIGYNITSLTIKGVCEDRESFFSEIEKTYRINTKRDLFE